MNSASLGMSKSLPPIVSFCCCMVATEVVCDILVHPHILWDRLQACRTFRTKSIRESADVQTESIYGGEACVGRAACPCSRELSRFLWAISQLSKYGGVYHGSFCRPWTSPCIAHHDQGVRQIVFIDADPWFDWNIDTSVFLCRLFTKNLRSTASIMFANF